MKVSVLHQTDLFHYHGDPDDHWDLACQFALAYMGETILKGIVIDYPPANHLAGGDVRDPSIQSVSQLNYITGQAVPVGVGLKESMLSDKKLEILQKDRPFSSGISLILNTLRDSPDPCMIYIVGSCRDVAAAASLDPMLFKEKCKAVYLNAGSAFSEGDREYNVKVDPFSYSKMFELPCPLYWMPCFNVVKSSGPECQVGEYGTFYRFKQSDIFSDLSDNLRKYFCYALGKVIDQGWLTYLERPVDARILNAEGKAYRNMWSTGGFFHLTGNTVTEEGDIVSITRKDVKPVFEFVPIQVSCDTEGNTKWKRTDTSDRYIFRVINQEKYQQAITKAMKTLLCQIP